MQFKKYDQLRT